MILVINREIRRFYISSFLKEYDADCFSNFFLMPQADTILPRDYEHINYGMLIRKLAGTPYRVAYSGDYSSLIIEKIKRRRIIKVKDFFVSYTGSDLNFAIWVAELLETNNFSVTIQAWDFRPGDNFVSKINEALIECRKLIVILSNSYLKSKWCEAEWTSKLAEQMRLQERRIIPIRIEPIDLAGLLSPIV